MVSSEFAVVVVFFAKADTIENKKIMLYRYKNALAAIARYSYLCWDGQGS